MADARGRIHIQDDVRRNKYVQDTYGQPWADGDKVGAE